MTFSSDNRSFFIEKQPFIPRIGEEETSNVVPISLLADLSQDLDWEKAEKKAIEVIQKGKYIFWNFLFGLETGSLLLEDTGRFLSYTLAIESFLKQLWPLFSEKSFGACLYQGNLDISSRFLYSPQDEKNIKESFLQEDVYCMSVFGEYIHRLASYLPDSLFPFCFFDASQYPPSKAAQLLSKERFAHLYLGVKGGFCSQGNFTQDDKNSWVLSQDVSVGILLPSDQACSKEVMDQLNKLAADLLKKEKQFRWIPEMLLNEQWDGLDLLFVMENSLTKQGKRRLQGFEAAGGEIILT